MAALQTPHPLSPTTITKAVDSLLKFSKSKCITRKPQLLDQDEDEYLYLILSLKKIPSKGRTNPYKIPLPNPLHPFDSASQERCLIFDDRSKSSLTSEIAKKKIQSENIPISKVLKLSKLKSDYRAFEAKRKLCGSYHMFFADKRIIPLLPKCLGKEFFKKKKIPVPIELGRKNWKEQIEGVCNSALLYLRTGTCSVVKVGRLAMGREELVENVIATINGVVEIVPKKWGNVRSFCLKLNDSVALPIYQTVPELGLRIEDGRKEEEVKGESQGESGEEGVEKSGKRKKKRGRIHEVRYMDNGDVMDDGFSDDNEDDGNLNVEMDGVGLEAKKLKKSGDVKKKKKEKNVGSLQGKGVEEDKSGEKSGNEDDGNLNVETDGVGLEAKKLKKSGDVKKKKKEKNVGSLQGKGVEEDKSGEKSGKLMKGGATKKKNDVVSSEGKGVEEDNSGEAVGDFSGSIGVKKSGKKKGGTLKKKKGVVSLEGPGRKEEINDDEVVGDVAVSGDVKKKNTTKIGKTDSSGTKLKRKKSKRL